MELLLKNAGVHTLKAILPFQNSEIWWDPVQLSWLESHDFYRDDSMGS